MAKYKEAVCIHYIAMGQCRKGREACHEHYCQKCNKYYPRAKAVNTNRKIRSDRNNYKLADLKEYKKNKDY